VRVCCLLSAGLQVGRAVLGRPGEILVEIMQWCGYYLTGVVQIAFMGATWDQTFRSMAWSKPICTDQWMLITAAVLLPVIQVPSFTQFGRIALLASIITLYSTAVYLGQILHHGQYVGGRDTIPGVSIPCYDQWSYSTMLASISNMAFTFGGHGTFPEQIREMRDPNHFHYAFNILYGLAVPFYAGCAVLAFWAFGNMNSAVNTENLADGIWLHAAQFATLATGFINVVLGQVVLMLKVELPLGVLPTDTWHSTSEAHLDSSAAAALHKLHVPPLLFRLVFRSLYLGSLLLIAEALVGAGLAVYVNIAGSLGLAAMTYWLPYAFYLAREWQQRRPAPPPPPSLTPHPPQTHGLTSPTAALSAARADHPPPARRKHGGVWRARMLSLLFLVNLVGGLFISVMGLYFNGKALATTQMQLFHEVSCKEGSHFWGGQMWDPHLPPNASAYTTLVLGCCANGTGCGS